jgi:hypothetical protein
MKNRFLLLIIVSVWIAILACQLPGSVGFDEKRPPDNPPSAIPPLTPYPTELVASPMPTLNTPPTAVVRLESSEDVRQFMLFSYKRWHTLWADLRLVYYAPDGVSVAQTGRTMVWINQPGQIRIISAPEGTLPASMWVSDGNYYSDNGAPAQPYTASNTFYEPPPGLSDTINPHPLEGVFGNPTGSLIFPQGLAQRAGEYQIVGQETYNGRQAIIIEWSRQPGIVIDRFWVDAQYGFLLRWLNFSKPGGGLINSEILVTAVLVNPSMPENAFAIGLPKPVEFPVQQGDLPPAP